MAFKLKNLITKEISFCKKGANPDAVIEIYKSVDPEPELKGLQATVHKILKHLGLDEPLKKEQTVQKGLFTTNWQVRELKSNFYDILWVLEDTFYQIMNDDEIKDKASAVAAAISEFSAVITEKLPGLNVKKHIEVRDQLIIPIRDQVHKLLDPEPEVHNDSEGGKEEMTEEQIKKLIEDVTASVSKSVIDQLPEVVKSVVTEQLKPVQEEVGKINTKVEQIGKLTPGSQQIEGQEPLEKTENFWGGVL